MAHLLFLTTKTTFPTIKLLLLLFHFYQTIKLDCSGSIDTDYYLTSGQLKRKIRLSHPHSKTSSSPDHSTGSADSRILSRNRSSIPYILTDSLRPFMFIVHCAGPKPIIGCANYCAFLQEYFDIFPQGKCSEDFTVCRNYQSPRVKVYACPLLYVKGFPALS